MTTSTGRKGWVGVDRRWLAAPELEDGALRLMLWLESHSDEFLARMNIAKTAEALGTSRNRVKRLVGVLEELNLISTEQMPRQYGGTVTKFTLHLDAWSGGPIQTTVPVSDGPQRTSAMVHGEARAVVHGAPPSYEYPQLIEEQFEENAQSTTLALVDAEIVVAEVVADFDAWYGRWPRKQGKAEARLRWEKMTADQRSASFDALPGWERLAEVEGNAFLPYASTWLNQSRWEDEPPVVTVIEQKPLTTARGMGALRARAARILAEEAAQ